MQNDNAQKELFEFEKPKKIFPRFRGIFPGPNLENSFSVTMTLDKLIFVAIAMIMLLVVVYALGVERGKAVRARPVKPAPAAAVTAVMEPQVRVEKEALGAAPSIEPKKPVSAAFPVAGYYTVVAGAFTGRAMAEKEAAAISGRGFDAFVSESGRYYIVCIGRFAGNGAARPILDEVKKMRKDAYIKKR